MAVFTKEEKAMLALSIDLKLKSLVRASKGCAPSFSEVYVKEVSAYKALEAKVASL